MADRDRERWGNEGFTRRGASQEDFNRRDYGSSRQDYNRDFDRGYYSQEYFSRDFDRDFNQDFNREYDRDYGRGTTGSGQNFGRPGASGRGSGYGYGSGSGYGPGSGQRANYGYDRNYEFERQNYGPREGSYRQGNFEGGAGQSWSYTEVWFVPGPFTGRGPRNYQRSDERIHEDISERLTQHGRIDATEIEVTVNHGEVTLTGAVDDRSQKRMAEDVAESVSGVKDVHNQLRVKQPNQGQFSQAQHPGATQPTQATHQGQGAMQGGQGTMQGSQQNQQMQQTRQGQAPTGQGHS